MARRKTDDELLVGAEAHLPGGIELTALYEQREEFYRTILDNLAEGVIITDGDDRILYVNSRMSQMSGYTQDELVGRIGYEVLSRPKDWKRMSQRARSRLVGEKETYEIELKHKDGTVTWARVSAAPYRDPSARIVGSIGTVTCIDRQKTLERENEYLRDELLGSSELIGPSAGLERIRNQIAMVAATDSNVLIYGESGTGKELVARSIHEQSRRRAQPLVRVNCAAIPKELFESEFFGHIRGSFTGAVRDRVGRFELANGGTLFLDEIGEIPLDLQGKLLRVIQEGQFERVGEERTRTVDVRLISATNRDLLKCAGAGRFRSDLYYRLSVFPIEIPPLRERRDDVAPLAERFLRTSARKLGIEPPTLSRAQMKALEEYAWPGNVRELQNVIERAAILAAHGSFELHLDNAQPAPAGHAVDALKQSEREMIEAALREARGKIYGGNGAAALLGMKPTTLASKLARLGLNRDDFLNG